MSGVLGDARRSAPNPAADDIGHGQPSGNGHDLVVRPRIPRRSSRRESSVRASSDVTTRRARGGATHVAAQDRRSTSSPEPGRPHTLDRIVDAHVEGVVAAEHDALGADGGDEGAQPGSVVHERVEPEPPQVARRRVARIRGPRGAPSRRGRCGRCSRAGSRRRAQRRCAGPGAGRARPRRSGARARRRSRPAARRCSTGRTCRGVRRGCSRTDAGRRRRRARRRAPRTARAARRRARRRRRSTRSRRRRAPARRRRRRGRRRRGPDAAAARVRGRASRSGAPATCSAVSLRGLASDPCGELRRRPTGSSATATATRAARRRPAHPCRRGAAGAA